MIRRISFRSQKVMLYELLYIIPQNLKTEVTSIIEKVNQLIKEVGGRILKEENWGQKKLSYPIKGVNQGFYVLIEFEIIPSSLLSLKENLRLSSEILRYQILKKKDKGETKKDKAEESKENLDKLNEDLLVIE